ncbi:uncharacterized protein LOC120170764 [Hibiscus syriacus]|uniref:uncharacterized protein LOC120170764 n=1 Tax=Hibiscus syriacus TaxID=106335 RepID=UPI0019242EAF|nr:uncharacterized protein LOC120170764 [Hibiscus syriacus]
MVKAGFLAPYSDTPECEDGNNYCYHNEEGHDVQDCTKFKALIQLMMNMKEVKFYKEVQDTPEADIFAIGDSSERGYGTSYPLVITPKVKPTDKTHVKVVKVAPRPFPYKDNKQVPWKLPMDISYMRTWQSVVQAFNGPATYNIEFLVMNIMLSYNCLLGRPWIHQDGVVPSTLHQKVKFFIDETLIIINVEEDIVASVNTNIPYIHINEEALEC